MRNEFLLFVSYQVCGVCHGSLNGLRHPQPKLCNTFPDFPLEGRCRAALDRVPVVEEVTGSTGGCDQRLRCSCFFIAHISILAHSFPPRSLLLTCEFFEGRNHGLSECISPSEYVNVYVRVYVCVCVCVHIFVFISFPHWAAWPPQLSSFPHPLTTRHHLADRVRQSMDSDITHTGPCGTICPSREPESALVTMGMIISILQMKKLRLIFFTCHSLIDNQSVLVTQTLLSPPFRKALPQPQVMIL